jgi:hypothetical protein
MHIGQSRVSVSAPLTDVSQAVSHIEMRVVICDISYQVTYIHFRTWHLLWISLERC